MAEVYIIPNRVIKESTYVDDNVEDKHIKIATLDAQEQILEPVLGTALYEKIIDGVLNKTLNETYQRLTVDFIWPVLLQASVYKLSYNMLFRLTNSAIVKDSNENSSGVSISEVNILIKERQLSMNYHISKLTKHLQAYSSTYPEYLGAQDLDGDVPETATPNVDFYDWEE